MDTVHGLFGMGGSLSHVVVGIKAVPCPNVEVSGSVYLPTTILDQDPTQTTRSTMRFYNQQHRFYCGIDLHARTMHLCILDHDGHVVFDRNLACRPDAFLHA